MRTVMTCILAIATAQAALSQETTHERFLTGSAGDARAEPLGGYVLAGGGGDVASAMAWFKDRVRGGDIVVIRASGGDGYNDFLYTGTEGARPDSVETILFRSRDASFDETVLAALRGAEGVFIAGGAQSRYAEYWKDTPVEAVLNDKARMGAVLGGTSAGLAILGEHSFVAMNGTVRSAEALANPRHERVTIEHDFLRLAHLERTITDSHFSERDRHGRLLVFMATILADTGAREARAIGIDEATALTVTPEGVATVHSRRTGSVFFMRAAIAPGALAERVPLTLENVAVQRVGAGASFDLSAWTADDAERFAYSVVKGELLRREP